MSKLMPGRPVPDLSVPLAGGGTWTLSEQKPETFTVIEVYRGYHCPRCRGQLLDMGHKVARYAERGCSVIAISTDPKERAEKTVAEWGVGELAIGYGLSIDQARAWGLYISEAIRDTETGTFAEPGLFIVRPDMTLYSNVIHSTPFHRHHHADVLEAIDMIRARNYPPRGTVGT
jgi:peroxiredoxin